MDVSLFRRDNSKVHLPSRPSLITLMLENSDRSRAAASHSISTLHRMRSSNSSRQPSAPSLGSSGEDSGLRLRQPERAATTHAISAASNVQAIPMPQVQHNFATGCLSPRTTRTHMVQAELTASLRLGIVHARKTNNAANLQRRHTSQNIAALRQYPEKLYLKDDHEVTASAYIFGGAANGYHDRGW